MILSKHKNIKNGIFFYIYIEEKKNLDLVFIRNNEIKSSESFY